ncbi:MAG: hypothetical protein COA78_22050 [Blastopirellula sp.]|nr:MAG: hypothetical protein COA78_22050 [Blastopirellula sp.]
MNILEKFEAEIIDEDFVTTYNKYDAQELQVELDNYHGNGDELTFDESFELSNKIKDIVSNLNEGYSIEESQDPSCQTYDTQASEIGLLPSQRN